MSQFASILSELHALEAGLKATATRLWEIKFSLLSAGADEDNEFLIRRLTSLKEVKEGEFQSLLDRLHRLISLRLDRALFIFHSADDVANLARINRALRSLNNAFARELELGQTWARLNSMLPAGEARKI